MRRILIPLCLLAAGCNAPMAAVMDTCFPSRAKSKPPEGAAGPTGPGVDVRPNPDPVRPGPNPNPNPSPGPLPPPDFGQ